MTAMPTIEVDPSITSAVVAGLNRPATAWMTAPMYMNPHSTAWRGFSVMCAISPVSTYCTSAPMNVNTTTNSDDGEQQVHRDAGDQDDRALPKRQAAVLLAVLALEQLLGVRHGARLPQRVGGGRGDPLLLGAADLAARRAHFGRAVGVEPVLLRRADRASPLDELLERLVGVLGADAAIQGDVLHRSRCRGGGAPPAPRAGAASSRPAPCRTRARSRRAGSAVMPNLVPSRREADTGAGQAQHELRHAHAERACAARKCPPSWMKTSTPSTMVACDYHDDDIHTAKTFRGSFAPL